MPKRTFEHRDPRTLRNHPLSIELYGETMDEEFLESVKRLGRILEPLRILPNGTVISGRRRRIAAVKFGIKRVPVVVERDLTDKLDIEEQIIFSNRPNEKTTEQRAKEYVKLKEIESERAEMRRLANLKKGQKPAEIPDPGKVPGSGEAREAAAEQVGLSVHTAEKAVEVIERIEALEEKGQTNKAEQLRETLNENVAAAHRAVSGTSARAKKIQGTDPGTADREIQKHFGKLLQAVDLRAKLSGGRGKHWKACEGSLRIFLESWKAWKKAGKGAQ